jgi:hypothetical protein
MTGVEAILRRARELVSRPFTLHGDAGAAAVPLFLLADVHQLRGDPQVRELIEQYFEKLKTSGREDVLAHQLRYASRLAQSAGDLGYEELHKLFSLLDEIHALRALGLQSNEADDERTDAGIRVRLARQRSMARQVAEDRAEAWSRSLWWYADSLAS